MKIIVISSALKEKHIEMIENTAQKAGAEVYFYEDEINAGREHPDAEVVYGFGMYIARKNHDLKWLCVPSAGVDFMMRPGAFANENCILTNSSGSFGVSIAEHIIAVSLIMMRQLTGVYEEVVQGKWGAPRYQRSLKDCRITVLGTGDIGRCFARRARAFEPESMIGVCRSGRCEEPCFDRVISVEELDGILPLTDLLVMSLPDTEDTRGILSRKRLMLLPEGAYIVNVGRGSAIDEEALADLLDAGVLGGAALDVFKKEPLPADSRLWKTKNLLITPHVAGNLTMDYTLDKNVEMFCEDLQNYAQGRPLKYIVDRRKGY